MVRYAVGYRSRAFVTFGAPIPVDGCDAASRTRRARAGATGPRARSARCYKVLPTALFAAAMRPSIARRDLEARIDRLIDELRGAARQPRRHQRPAGGRGGGRAARDARHHRRSSAAASACASARVLRYYARTIEHLLAAPAHALHRIDARQRVEGVLPPPRREADPLKQLASRYGMRQPTQLRAPVHRRRDRRGSDRRGPRASRRAACCMTLDYLGESVASARRGGRRDRATTCAIIDAIVDVRHRAQHLAEADAARARRRSRRRAVDNLRRILERAEPAGFFVRIDMENSPYTEVTLDIFETLWQPGLPQHRRGAAVDAVSQRAGRRSG